MLKILIAEDDRELRQLFTHVLNKSGYTVNGVVDGVEALDALEKDRRVEISQKYSKETEHSANNMDFLFRSMKKSRCYGIHNIVNILSEGENI